MTVQEKQEKIENWIREIHVSHWVVQDEMVQTPLGKMNQRTFSAQYLGCSIINRT